MTITHTAKFGEEFKSGLFSIQDQTIFQKFLEDAYQRVDLIKKMADFMPAHDIENMFYFYAEGGLFSPLTLTKGQKPAQVYGTEFVCYVSHYNADGNYICNSPFADETITQVTFTIVTPRYHELTHCFPDLDDALAHKYLYHCLDRFIPNGRICAENHSISFPPRTKLNRFFPFW